MHTLYENIKRFRIQKGITQQELATKAGYTDKSMIAKIEKGLVDLPQSKVNIFAEIFGVTLNELYECNIVICSAPIKTVRCPYQKLSDYCSKIGREHIISITSCFGEQYGGHFFTLVYDTPGLVLVDCYSEKEEHI